MTDNIIKEDYMGKISWSRITCGAPIPMFGSEIATSNPIVLRISKASEDLSRGVANKHIMADARPFIEVEMTPVQWAELLTSGCVSDGVPCTIRTIDGKRMSSVKPKNVLDEYKCDVDASFKDFETEAKSLSKFVEDIYNSGKTMNRTQMKELAQKLSWFANKPSSQLEYIRDRFNEDMSDVVVKAKSEINAYAESNLAKLGIQCLMNGTDVAGIEHIKDTDNE